MGKTPKIPVTDFYATVLYSWCLSADELVELWVDDKQVPGVANVLVNTSYNISDRGFRGGDKKSGGISGVIEVMMGDASQTLSTNYASKLRDELDNPLTPATAPAYRGLLTTLFRGAVSGEYVPPAPGTLAALFAPLLNKPGFLWGSNTPVIPPAKARVRRESPYLNSANRIVEIDGYKHANPICVMFELLTVYGGKPDTLFKTAEWEAAAATIKSEGFGVSFVWRLEKDLGDVIGELEDTINAKIYEDPNSGLIGIRLIREDYNPLLVTTLNEDEIVVTDFERRLRTGNINAFTVTYKNARTGNEESVRAVDEAGITMNAGVVRSGTKTYGFIRSATLALFVAERDLRTGALPLARGTIKAPNSAAGLAPGDVFRFKYPRETAEEYIVGRVLKITRGGFGNKGITIEWAEDIFAQPTATVTTRDATLAPPVSAAPVALAAQDAFSAPYALVGRIAGLELSDADYPNNPVGLLGDQTGFDTSGFLAIGPATSPGTGAIEQDFLGVKTISDRVLTVGATAANATVITIAPPDAGAPADGDILILGTEAGTEWALVSSSALSGGNYNVTVKRGVLDTTPKDWPASTAVWIISRDYNAWDTDARPAGVSVTYTLLTQTSQGTLDYTLAAPLDYEPIARAYKPTRPANVSVDGVSYGTKVYVTDPAGGVPVTWANRNRTTEDAVILAWTDASTAGEAGQTTKIEIRTVPGNALHGTESSLSGTSHTIPLASFGTDRYYDLVFLSERDGQTSFQGHRVRVDFSSRP